MLHFVTFVCISAYTRLGRWRAGAFAFARSCGMCSSALCPYMTTMLRWSLAYHLLEEFNHRLGPLARSLPHVSPSRPEGKIHSVCWLAGVFGGVTTVAKNAHGVQTCIALHFFFALARFCVFSLLHSGPGREKSFMYALTGAPAHILGFQWQALLGEIGVECTVEGNNFLLAPYPLFHPLIILCKVVNVSVRTQLKTSMMYKSKKIDYHVLRWESNSRLNSL